MSKGAVKGSAVMTKKMREQYGTYNRDTQINGTQAPDKWEDYLAKRGYALDAAGLVYKSDPSIKDPEDQ